MRTLLLPDTDSTNMYFECSLFYCATCIWHVTNQLGFLVMNHWIPLEDSGRKGYFFTRSRFLQLYLGHVWQHWEILEGGAFLSCLGFQFLWMPTHLWKCIRVCGEEFRKSSFQKMNFETGGSVWGFWIWMRGSIVDAGSWRPMGL